MLKKSNFLLIVEFAFSFLAIIPLWTILFLMAALALLRGEGIQLSMIPVLTGGFGLYGIVGILRQLLFRRGSRPASFHVLGTVTGILTVLMLLFALVPDIVSQGSSAGVEPYFLLSLFLLPILCSVHFIWLGYSSYDQ